MISPLSRWLAVFLALMFLGSQSISAGEICLEGGSPDGRTGVLAVHCNDDGPSYSVLCSNGDDPLKRATAVADQANPSTTGAPQAAPPIIADRNLRLAAYGQVPLPGTRIVPFSIVFRNFRS